MNFYSILLYLGFLATISQGQDCYDDQGNAQMCSPPFVNAAFNRSVQATNTCGQAGPTEFCPFSRWGQPLPCQVCDAQSPRTRHPPQMTTDAEFPRTWWQSDTMLDGIRYPVVINLTLDFRKAYDITYTNLRFQTAIPESFAIYKKTTESSDWTPYQFFSASCRSTYGKPGRRFPTTADEAICTNQYSDLFPLTGGRVPFSTLGSRPGAFSFDNNPVLQEWVTASAIRISLTRMNTFGDEDFGGDTVLKSYYYAISDISVGARCKCNGHASECYTPDGQESDREVCRCQHNTSGVDCEKCLPMYNDKPWARATSSSANQCQRCECNNKADSCSFDQDLYQRTGRGGRCVDCRDNTDGPHCERCKDNHYLRSSDGRCTPCDCDPVGSDTLQCDGTGQCQCKSGYTGEKCTRSSSRS